MRALLRLLTSSAWWLVRGPLLSIVIKHVAYAGFTPPPPFQRADPTIIGQAWSGRVIAQGDRLPAAEVHYLKHVVVQREWPPGTTLADYLASLEALVHDSTSSIVISRIRSRWHLAVVGRSGPFQGPNGYRFTMVEYRILAGRWMTGFQLQRGLAHFRDPRRSNVRWIRQPR